MSQETWRVCVDFGTAWSKAAMAPADPADAFQQVRPLAIGRLGGSNPFLTPCAVYIDEFRLLFGAPALKAAAAAAAKGREALLSFKTLLAAGDLDALLLQFPSRPVDPNQMFRQRDLIVLFLAHLTHLICAAMAADGVDPDAPNMRWRYVTPGWRRAGTLRSEAHRAIADMFVDAAQIEARFGARLAQPEGIEISDAVSAMRWLENTPKEGPSAIQPMLEASAAAACHLSTRADLRHLLVLDMGAGTTDLGAIALRPGPKGPIAQEIETARNTLSQAGDLIDRLLINLTVDRAKDKSLQEQTALWRSLASTIRDSKETLFRQRKAAFRHRNRVITIHARDLEQDRDFKAMLRTITEAYQRSLDATVQFAMQNGQSEPTISVTLAGGGAGAPFMQELVRKTKPSNGRAGLKIEPSVPEWVHESRFGGNLAPVFPQMAIAMGGALAPDGLALSTEDAPQQAVNG